MGDTVIQLDNEGLNDSRDLVLGVVTSDGVQREKQRSSGFQGKNLECSLVAQNQPAKRPLHVK